jgi:prevent-host-death family protein
MAKRSPKPLMRNAKGSQSLKSGAVPSRGLSAKRTPSAVTPAKAASSRAHNHQSVPATQAKNRFGEILLAVRDSGTVFIERHGQAQAVVLGIDAYNKLTSNERTTQERELDYWVREFNALYAGMQTQKSRQAVDDLFSATDADLNRKGS